MRAHQCQMVLAQGIMLPKSPPPSQAPPLHKHHYPVKPSFSVPLVC